MLAEIWRATAIVLVILVAGMQLIPKEYYEAAEVFGAGPWKRLHQDHPADAAPSLQTALILRTILAFEVFAVVLALGGTNMPVLMGETYQWQFELQNRGVAAAYAMLILVISIAATSSSCTPCACRREPGYDRAPAATIRAPPPARRAPPATGCCSPASRPLRLGAAADLPRCSSTPSRRAGHRLAEVDPAVLRLRQPAFFLELRGRRPRALELRARRLADHGPVDRPRRARPATRSRASTSPARRPSAAGADDPRLPAAAPGAAARRVLHPSRALRHALGLALVHTTLALPFAVLVTLLALHGHPGRARGGRLDLRLHPAAGLPQGDLPLALPGIAATAIFAFVISWNEVFAAAVLTIANRTLTAYLLQSLADSPPYRFAGGCALIVPALIFIFAVRKYLFAMWGIANR